MKEIEENTIIRKIREKDLSLKKSESNIDDSQFYLSYNHIDDIVEIICDIDIDNNVSKEILIDHLSIKRESTK